MKRIFPLLLLTLILGSCVADFADEIFLDDRSLYLSGSGTENPFLTYCLSHFDTDSDSKLSPEEIAAVRTIDCRDLGIKNLSGIEMFSRLDTLICSGNLIEALPLEGCKGLVYLDCSANLICDLNVSMTDIKVLYCCPMDDAEGRNLLRTLVVRRDQKIEYVTENRMSAPEKRIPDETLIMAVPQTKDGLQEIREDDGGHGFDNDGGAQGEAYVVPSFDF